MKQENMFSRYHLLWLLILCYLMPLLGLSVYGAMVPREAGDWNILCIGFLLTTFGTLILYFALARWESLLKLNLNSQITNENVYEDIHHETQSKQFIDLEEYELLKRSLAEAQQVQIRLLSEIEMLTEEVQKKELEKNEIHQRTQKILNELDLTKRSTRQELELQQNHIRELHEAIADLKALHEKKQQEVVQLENKVGSLTGEIKTLLQFAESRSKPLIPNEAANITLAEEPTFTEKNEIPDELYAYQESPIQTIQEASFHLKKCLNIAQKIKGSQRFGSQIYSFLDSPADNFSIDLRRLCDRLRGETQSVVLLYSPQDSHLLFASNQIKLLSGWSPEKFAQSFFDLLIDATEWQQGIESLVTRSEAQIKMHLKTRSGQTTVIDASLGMIPTGIFRNHVIAILYSSEIHSYS